MDNNQVSCADCDTRYLILCPDCNSKNLNLLVDSFEKEFVCNDCGITFNESLALLVTENLKGGVTY